MVKVRIGLGLKKFFLKIEWGMGGGGAAMARPQFIFEIVEEGMKKGG